MCVYFRAKVQVSSIILWSFRQREGVGVGVWGVGLQITDYLALQIVIFKIYAINFPIYKLSILLLIVIIYCIKN